jgi:peroxiredoxin
MTLSVGDKIPAVTLFRLADGAPEAFDAPGYFAGRKVALFAVPGAFTRTCSEKHLPGFVRLADEIRAKGVDAVVCLSVNDAAVMNAWGLAHGAAGKVDMVADGLAAFTKAAGFDSDMSARGYGVRSRRYSMVVDNGTVIALHTEKPGEFGESSAETLLARL